MRASNMCHPMPLAYALKNRRIRMKSKYPEKESAAGPRYMDIDEEKISEMMKMGKLNDKMDFGFTIPEIVNASRKVIRGMKIEGIRLMLKTRFKVQNIADAYNKSIFSATN